MAPPKPRWPKASSERIVESFLYADAIAGEQPDLEKAVEILKLMLR